MAEYAVSFVVERLGDLLIQEVTFLHGVQGQIQRLKIELKRMQCFLRDADAKQGEDERVRNWVAEIRDAAYDAEDVVDNFILEVTSRRRRGILQRYARIFNKSLDIHKVGNDIELIQTRIRDISSSRETYGIRNIGETGDGTSFASERLRRLRHSYPHAEEVHVIGLQKDTEALVEQLMKEDGRFRVVSIVGMGGLGKTTLAKKVYNHSLVKRSFEYCAWVFISQQFQLRDVLQEILKSFGTFDIEDVKEKPKKKLTEEVWLVEKLYQVLTNKRYLVVLDDIWSTEAWDLLKPAFPNGKIGSKLMFTTRNKEVALYADAQSILHEPRFLTEEESWDLFCKKAFPHNRNTSEGCYTSPGLEKLGKEMVGKCGGLPLAVVVLGGLLATKKSMDEWETVRKSIIYHLSKGQQSGVLGILALSYYDLPYYLKPCFLYLGLFPEDFEIPTNELIRLWISEGFTRLAQHGYGEETLEEDIAKEFFAELIHRCMVQVGRIGSAGRVKTCRLHDLMRDLCISKGREENFLEIFLGRWNMVVDSSSFTTNSRRRAIHFGDAFEHGNQHLRSLFVFNALDCFALNFECREFKLLRVLYVVSAHTSLPRKIGNLIHLRYLRFSGEVQIPPSIGKLTSLQTLDLKGYSSEIPNVIWKMKQLRYLILSRNVSNANLRVDTLINLGTLRNIDSGSWIQRDLLNLTNLRKLKIIRILELKEVLESPILQLASLRSLSLNCFHFSKLSYSGKIKEELQLHHLHCFHELLPPNLTKLTLKHSRLEQDPMPSLAKMPNLRILHLQTFSYFGKKMVCPAKGFPQLESLQLLSLEELNEMIMEMGAMPSLRRLEIRGCDNLRMLPEGLRFVTTLLELEITNMPTEFNCRLAKDGEDWGKVKHIPTITIRLIADKTIMASLHQEHMQI